MRAVRLAGFREDVLAASSEGRLREETRAALEDALTACEDWLYEEGVYDINDAAMFDDRLAQIEGLMGASMGVATPGGDDGHTPGDVS